MSPDLLELEATLRQLRPSAPGGQLLARLEASAGNTLTCLSPAEAQLENSLRQIKPAALPCALMATLEATLSSAFTTPAPSIIPFPANVAPAAARRHGNHPMLAAAAAVALLGAAAALFMPSKNAPQSAAAPSAQPPHAAPLTTAPATPPTPNFVPAAFNTGLGQASDEGVVWQAKNQPQRVVKVIYRDRITLVNPQGQTIEYEKPRVEYILVPEKID
jgi:hypothetical protein